MGFMRSFILGLMGSIGFGRMGAAMSMALSQADIVSPRRRADHSQTVYRRSGSRAHRNWSRRRASGRKAA